MKDVVVAPMRSVIVWTLAACAALAMAPWFSGGQEPLARLIGGGALLLGVLFLWRERAVRRLAAGPLVWSYLGLAAWGALSLTWSANHYSTTIWLINILTAGLVFRLAFSVAGEVGGRERLVRLYLFSAVAFCAYGLYLYVTGDYDRLTGSFYWANPAAAYLIPGIMVALDRIGAQGYRRWLWAGLLALLGSAFIVTDSRGAALVLVLIVGVFLLIRRANRRYWITLVFSALAVIGLSFGWLQLRQLNHRGPAAAITVAPGTRFAEAATGESRSLADRLNYISSGLQIWFEHPVLGTGAGTYRDVHPRYQRQVVSAATSAHTYYLQTLAELGLLGAVLLAGVVLMLLFGSVRGIVHDPAALPLLLGLVGLLLHIGLDIDSEYPALLLLAAAWAGLIYQQRWREPRRASWRLLGVAALLLVPLASLFQSDSWAIRARAAQADGDYATAASDFEGAHRGLLYNPDIVNAEGIDYYTLANSGVDAKANSALALDRARTAERLDPSDAQHHQLEGRILWLQGKLTEAEAAFRASLSLDPYNHPDYAYDLASIQAAQGRLTEAIASAEAMIAQYPANVLANRNADTTLKPSVANLYALAGNIQLQRGNLSAARTAAAASLKLEPQNLRGRALEVQLDKLSQ